MNLNNFWFNYCTNINNKSPGIYYYARVSTSIATQKFHHPARFLTLLQHLVSIISQFSFGFSHIFKWIIFLLFEKKDFKITVKYLNNFSLTHFQLLVLLF